MIEKSVIQFLDVPAMTAREARTDANMQDMLDFKIALKGENGSCIHIVPEHVQGPSMDKVTLADSVSDQIMDRLDDVRESARKQHEEIAGILEKAADNKLDVQEMMQMQVAMYRLNYQLELTSRISSGAKDGLETLYKNQG